ncbi:MAG TPA: hypothetical protein PKD87_15320 [Burkholderiaceae bacterium]|nr:hypothetical protein [Burkholderiaceae bacterium]
MVAPQSIFINRRELRVGTNGDCVRLVVQTERATEVFDLELPHATELWSMLDVAIDHAEAAKQAWLEVPAEVPDTLSVPDAAILNRAAA